MKILVIKSSPHKNSSSNLLADQFIKGALENGHEIKEFDAGHAGLQGCLSCNYCKKEGICCQKDDMAIAREMILEADLIAFVTPLYYFGMSAQLKMVIDRLYSFTVELQSMHKKCVMICASWDNNEKTFSALECHYEIIYNYLQMTNCGTVLGGGCGSMDLTNKSEHMQTAYELGKSLK